MNIEVFDDDLTLASSLASRLIDRLAAKPGLVLGLPTGRTPLLLYRELARRTAAEEIDWSHARTFNLDEFVGLGGSDRGSYRAFMQQALFDHLSMDPAHIGMLDGRAPDLDAEAARYERAIAGAGGIDIQILGIGANGHIGFNEPSAHLRSRTHVATLQPASRTANAFLFDGNVERVPARALSVGMATILAAKEIILMATGPEKAGAIAAMADGRIDASTPASYLQMHPAVTVMLDQAAAAGLNPRRSARGA